MNAVDRQTEPLLFSPIKIRNLELRNRIVLAPMLTYSANNGHISDWHLAHLGKYAVGGVGLVFMESTKVDPRGCTTPRDPGLWKDEFIEPLKKVTAFIKQYGAAAGIQLGHSGRKARNSLPWEGRDALHQAPSLDPDFCKTWEIIGPSAISHYPDGPVPREMTLTDIQGQIDLWGNAARRAHEAGFDVLEIHGAHGYLIHQFLSSTANQRTDQYGGSPENRRRFAIEVASRVRQVWPADKPLFFRVSSVDESGLTIDDTIELCRALKQVGVDVIDCSSGGMTGASIVSHSTKVGFGYQVPYAQAIREHAGIMTMAVGLIIHADQAEAILQQGQADLVAVGRELLHNPNWVLDAATKLGVANRYQTVPANYGYWLEKRAQAGFEEISSTWLQRFPKV